MVPAMMPPTGSTMSATTGALPATTSGSAASHVPDERQNVAARPEPSEGTNLMRYSPSATPSRVYPPSVPVTVV